MKKILDGVKQFQTESFTENQDLFEGLASGQQPLALFITCADSRIDPNLLTQTLPGELFVQRTAGNIVPAYGNVLGGEACTIEYAVTALKISDIVICGHSQCGAMAGLLAPEAIKTMPAVRAYLEHAEATRRIMEENHHDVTDAAERLKLAVEANVLVQIENLKTHPSVAAAIARDQLNLHGWVYQFETGQVSNHDPEKNQFVPLATPNH